MHQPLFDRHGVYLQQFHGHIFCTFAFCSRKAETLFIYLHRREDPIIPTSRHVCLVAHVDIK